MCVCARACVRMHEIQVRNITVYYARRFLVNLGHIPVMSLKSGKIPDVVYKMQMAGLLILELSLYSALCTLKVPSTTYKYPNPNL